jgi:hypothetical protein
MSVRIDRLLSYAEYIEMNKAAIAKGWYHGDRRMFTPGMCWPEPWYHDPLGELEKYRQLNPDENCVNEPWFFKRNGVVYRTDYQTSDGKPVDVNTEDGFLSPHYWRDWSDIRPPLAVLFPHGENWELDRRSSNGNGWTVKFTKPDLSDLSVSPSIVVDGYHGWLGVNGTPPGQFSADLEGRGPMGKTRVFT